MSASMEHILEAWRNRGRYPETKTCVEGVGGHGLSCLCIEMTPQGAGSKIIQRWSRSGPEVVSSPNEAMATLHRPMSCLQDLVFRTRVVPDQNVDFGMTSIDFGSTLTLGWFWDDLGLTLVWPWVDVGLTFGWHWYDFGMTVGWFWDDFGIILGSVWD